MAGWLDKCAKGCIALHGEGMDRSPEEQQENRAKCLALLTSTMEKHTVPCEQLYNADQTGLSSINYQTESTLIGMTRTFMELSK